MRKKEKTQSRMFKSILGVGVIMVLLTGAGTSLALANNVERYQIFGNLYHYIWYEQVGPGTYDVIRVHRIVKETAPWQPKVTRDALFLVHGANVTFETCFLPSLLTPSTPDAQSFAVYLALRNVDVWGIDHSSILVPPETVDFSFMEDWDLQRQIDEIAVGLDKAQSVREATGSGPGKLHYLGFSQGGIEGYAYLNMESQEPCAQRRVRGFIPVDIWFKTDYEASRLECCFEADAARDQIANGIFQDEQGNLIWLLGFLAETDPDGPSPIIPVFTNLQAGLFISMIPMDAIAWHFWAGTFDESGLPDGLNYTSIPLWLAFLQSVGRYEPVAAAADQFDILCNEIEVPFDDFLWAIDVPVLYVGAAGGFGEFGVYSTTLLGSTDVTTHIVQLRPDEERNLDFGHADLFTAKFAKQQVWKTILKWIQSHRSDPCE